MASAVTVKGVREVQAVLDQIATVHLDMAKRELRDGTQQIAQQALIPILKRGAAASGVPIAARMADTARARKDRMVLVRVGAVNPKLSGFRRGQGKYKTTLALGSNYGPKGDVNNYAVPRNPSGHWVQPTVNSDGTYAKIKDEYRALLARILGKYSSSSALGRAYS
jgi:hypothetical protein